MSISALLNRRLRVVLALLVLVPTLVLAVGGTQAKAAGWTTMASGWSTGKTPSVDLDAGTKADPTALRFQVVNQASVKREVSVSWYRSCWNGAKYYSASGSYDVLIAKGATHTKNVSVPGNVGHCDLSVFAYTFVSGKLTLKLQTTY